MASTHHAAAQHSRYPLVSPANTRDEFRLPSLKDLNFQYQPRGHSAHESPQHPNAGPVETTLNGQDNGPRHVQSWNRANIQPQSPPAIPMHHQHQHQHHQTHPHQQHTPPLSAGHEPPSSKVEYASKQDNGGFLTPGMPLSAQSTPVPGSLNIGPGARSDEGPHGPSQAKRRRSSANMGTPRDVRAPHTGYPPQYASYPPSQPQSLPPPGSYHQPPPGTHQGHPAPASQEPMHHHTVPVPHPTYHTYQPPPQQYMPPRAHPQHPPHHQPQPTHGNPYPSPGPPPAPPPQVAWEQPHHQQQPPQHHPHPHHLPPPPPPPTHTQHPQHPHHVPAHQQPPQPFPTQHSQQIHVQPQHQQHQPHPLHPPPPPHHSQHPQIHSQSQHPQAQHPQIQHPQSQRPQPQHSQPQHSQPQHPQPQHSQPQHSQPQHSQPQHSQPQHSQPQHPQLPPQQQPQHPHPQPPSQPQPQSHQSQNQHLPHPQHQPQLQQQQIPFARTTAIVPTNIDTRVPYVANEPDQRQPSARDSTMSEIVKHCTALYAFASHYAQLQASLPEVQPSASELAEMSQRAIQVVRLLEEYRRLNFPEAERTKFENVTASPDDHRPPKRPWEDISQDGNAGGPETASYSEQQPQQQYPTPVEKAQTTAEQDMEIIRTKRATSAAGGTGTAGQPKSKYRKRSRATPPGKCHSCNIRETPEWRRGPDGARTLCNACGLHYAKLMRKRDKAGGNGDAPRIDMDTLRASARAADLADKSHSRSKASRSQQSIEPTSPMEAGKPLPQQHHQGSFQLVQMMPQEIAPPPPHPEPIHVPPPQHPQHPHQPVPQSASSLTVAPPPPWATNAPSASGGGARGYPPEQLQHQSFMRTSQHSTATHTSPR